MDASGSEMTSATTKPKHILLLCGSHARQNEGLVQQLLGVADVREVGSFQEALNAMRNTHFDLIISTQPDFIALERAAATQQAGLTLESIGQGVCVIDADGRLQYANPSMHGFPTDLTAQVCQQCRRAFSGPRTPEPEAPFPMGQRAHRFGLTAGSDQYFEVTATPVFDEHRQLSQIVAVVWDVTTARRLQRKLDAIDVAGRELVQLGSEATAQLNIEDRIRLLEQQILKYMHDLLNFNNFAVLLVDKKTNKLEIILQHGMSPSTCHLDIYVSPEGNGISGYVAAVGRSYICHDIRADPRYIEGMEAARSSLTVPLRLHDKIIGVFDIESDRVAAFNEEDRQFAEILARYIAIALNTLDLLATERFQTTGRFADDVSTEIAGPLNDILTDAATLVEEYIGHDDLRKRLGAICDNVTLIKRTIREVASPRGGLLGRHDAVPQDAFLTGKRILVADDEDIIRETIEEVLTKLGCVVETAPDGAAAIALIEQRTYDVVLADIKMPHKNGYEIFAAVKDRSSTPVILMTGFGYDPNHSIVRARREGLAAVLFKPFKVDQLLGEIRRAVAPRPA